MSTNNLNEIEQSRTFILSACAMVAEGLKNMMSVEPERIEIIHPQHGQMLSINKAIPIGRVVVYLPDDPFWLLFTLKQAMSFLNLAMQPVRLLILSRSPIEWLWKTICNLSDKKDNDFTLHVMAPDLPCSRLASLLNMETNELSALKPQSLVGKLVRGQQLRGITKKELDILIDFFNGNSIFLNVSEREVSRKTAYSQRLSGLKKMVESFPQLKIHLPRLHQTVQEEKTIDVLSDFEQEFVQAIHSRKVFHVFKPVVDVNMKIQGMEVLTRWEREGRILYGEDFSSDLKSGYVWLLLTAQMLQTAVSKINQFGGNVYFSFTVHPTMTQNTNFIRMIDVARSQFHVQQWCRLLALEFSELEALDKDKQAYENLMQLHRRGISLVLAGSFTINHVLLPVWFKLFEKYKINKAIVEHSQDDQHTQVIIKCLTYYCHLTGAKCIAEGIDNLEKFRVMRNFEIENFQGEFISGAIHDEDLLHLTHEC